MPELVLLWRELQPQLPPSLDIIQIRNGARKKDWVDAVERVLTNEGIVQSLTRTRHPNPSPGLARSNIAQTSRYHPAATVTPQLPPRTAAYTPVPQPPIPMRQIPRSLPPDPRLPLCTSNGYYHFVPPPHPRMQRFVHGDAVRCPYPFPPGAIVGDPHFASTFNYRMPPVSLPQSALQTAANVKVKREPGPHTNVNTAATHQSTAAPDDRPLTLHDRHVMSALHQMGFENKIEILQAIRSNPNAGPDDCMMWIIKQREEQDEAQKMDAARARSEDLREQIEMTRKQDDIDRFERATMEELSACLFSTSVVLKRAGSELQSLKETHSTTLHNFLKLEGKIVKWYNDVSWCYFVDLAERWKSTELCVSDLESTICELEASIYSLEKQQGGIPAIFVDKRRDAERQGKPTRPPSDGLTEHPVVDDDDVVVVFEPLAKKPKMSTPPRQAEIIELL